MNKLIYGFFVFSFLMILTSCGSSTSSEKVEMMIEQKWAVKKVAIVDSMNNICTQNLNNNLSAQVDSILRYRGLK